MKAKEQKTWQKRRETNKQNRTRKKPKAFAAVLLSLNLIKRVENSLKISGKTRKNCKTTTKSQPILLSMEVP